MKSLVFTSFQRYDALKDVPNSGRQTSRSPPWRRPEPSDIHCRHSISYIRSIKAAKLTSMACPIMSIQKSSTTATKDLGWVLDAARYLHRGSHSWSARQSKTKEIPLTINIHQHHRIPGIPSGRNRPLVAVIDWDNYEPP